MAKFTGGLWQPALWVEHAEVSDEQMLLWLLSPNTGEPSDVPVIPCSAKILCILLVLSLSSNEF